MQPRSRKSSTQDSYTEDSTLYKTGTLGHNGRMAKKQLSKGTKGKGGVLLQELKTLAAQHGVRVREEKLLRGTGYRVRSGGCRVHGKDMVFLDRDTPVSERLELLLDELSQREIQTEQLSPPLRRMLQGGASQ